MKHINGIIYISRSAYPSFLNFQKSLFSKLHFVPMRGFISNWKYKARESINKVFKDSELKPLTGINDPNFTDHMMTFVRNPDFKKAFANFRADLKLLHTELKTDFKEKVNTRIDSEKDRIDMLFTFETQQDLDNFIVTTDSSSDGGYSTASLKLTQAGTALFSGNVCTEIPKDGNVKRTGFANFSNALQRKSFFRIKLFDWTNYTHLVFKVRGDGRTYVVMINIHNDYEEIKYMSFSHPLYTRGGPYWQIAKIPLSHFYLVSKGSILLHQNQPKVLKDIHRIGITVSGFDGPFKLEVDYIGLEKDDFHKSVCPYEAYEK